MSTYVSRRKLLAAARKMGLQVTTRPGFDAEYEILAPDGLHFEDTGLHAIQWVEHAEDKADWKAGGYAEELETLGTLVDCEPDCDCGCGKAVAS